MQFMKETGRALRSWGNPFYLPAACTLALLTSSCSEPQGLRIGEVELPYRQIEALERSLARSFASEGRATMLWHLLDDGLAEEALLHARLPEASLAARAAADVWAARLRAGEDFDAVLASARQTMPEQILDPVPQRPVPSALGGSIAAHAAAMEEGEWAGPLRSERGWEIVRLRSREAIPRAQAQVQLDRLVFPGGTAEDRDRARADWVKLPLSGNPELLDALPLEFRHGRARAESENPR
jgi:hypothetical protein